MHNASRYIALFPLLALAACGGPEAGDPAREPAQRAAVEQQPASYTAAPGAAQPAAPAAPASEAPAAGAPQAGETRAPAAAAAPVRRPAASAPVAAAPAAQPAPAAAAEESSGAAAILRRAERAYEGVRSLEADFTQAVTVPLLGSTQNSRGKLSIRRPDRFLMKFSDPAGDIVVSDGEHFWMYYPSTDPKQVLRTSARNGAEQMDFQKEFLSNAAERYTVARTGSEEVGGRTADVLVLTPRGPSAYKRVRIWVDREDALVRRFEIHEENDSVRRLELRNLKTNVALGDALFRFTPPAGAQVFTQ